MLFSGILHADHQICYKMITTTSPVTICQSTKLLQYYWLYSLWLILFYDWKFVSLNPLHLFCPTSLLLTNPSLPSVCVSLLLFRFGFFFVSETSHVSEIRQYLSFSIWLISGHSCCCKWQDFTLLYGWVIFHCMYHEASLSIYLSVDIWVTS